MKILITGSHGLVGSALVSVLKQEGHTVLKLVRSKPSDPLTEFEWDPERGCIDQTAFGGVEAVVHLAGDSIATGRWTEAKKERIRESRVQGTRLLSDVLSKLSKPPQVFISASAVGYYGNRGDEVLTEDSAPGQGFLTHVCQAWEEAAKRAQTKGLRVVLLRFGIVLSQKGGALQKMLLPFKMGVGGKIGTGRQYMSWIAIDDALGVIQHVMVQESAKNPINVVAPNPVTNREFTKTLGKVLFRPTLFPMPAFAARRVFGEMADALLLGGCRVQPKALLAVGYKFKFPDLEGALNHLIFP